MTHPEFLNKKLGMRRVIQVGKVLYKRRVVLISLAYQIKNINVVKYSLVIRNLLALPWYYEHASNYYLVKLFGN